MNGFLAFANAQTPFTYQVTYQITYTVRSPFTYQVSYPTTRTVGPVAKVKGVFVNDSGTLRKLDEVYVNDGGTLEKIHQSVPTARFSKNPSNTSV